MHRLSACFLGIFALVLIVSSSATESSFRFARDLSTEAENLKNSQASFARFDENNDQKISLNEFLGLFNINNPDDQQALAEEFTDYDKDNNRSLSFEEWKAQFWIFESVSINTFTNILKNHKFLYICIIQVVIIIY